MIGASPLPALHVRFSQVKHFMNNKLGISERQISMMTWAEVVHKVVLVQRTKRLCIAK